MTEKRFQYNVNKNTIEQDGKFVAYMNSVDGVRIANKLNVFQNENEQLKTQLQNTSAQRDEFHRGVRENANRVGKLEKENEQLKQNCKNYEWYKQYKAVLNENEELQKELKVYREVANCSNCKYQNYDWFEDGDEFEICEKGNNNQQMEYHICKEWVEF